MIVNFKEGIVDNAGIIYYVGRLEVRDLSQSLSPEHLHFYDRHTSITTL